MFLGVLPRSQSRGVVGPAPGRDRQQCQNTTNGKTSDNGYKTRHNEGQTKPTNTHNSVFR